MIQERGVLISIPFFVKNFRSETIVFIGIFKIIEKKLKKVVDI